MKSFPLSLIGLSTEPDDDPSGEIHDTIKAVHYAAYCQQPNTPLAPMRLGALDSPTTGK